MSLLVGVDSSLSLTSLVRGTTDTVLADCTDWLGRAPDFVFRPLGTGGGAAVPTTVAELTGVANGTLRIGLYFNDSPLSAAAYVVGTQAQGVADAKAARAGMTVLGCPTSVPILIDLEHYQAVTAAYVAGVKSIEPTAILYGVQQTCTLATAGGLRSWLSSWTTTGLNATNAAGKTMPAGATLWQMAGSAFGGIADEDVGPEAVIASFWLGPSSTPPTPPPAPPAPPPADPRTAALESIIATAQTALTATASA